MNFPKINKKAALIATVIGTLVVSNVATYRNSYSAGYKTSITESRVGYMPVPKKSGEIVVSEVDGKTVHYFEPYAETPFYDKNKAWNSDENRKYLEYSITTDAKVDDKPVRYVSASCVAQITPNFWDCTMRKLGDNDSEHWRVEVDPKTGNWSA